MAIGNNVKAYLGLQSDKDTLATEIVELLPTSASMKNAIDTVESEAFTGFRFKEDADTTSIYPDGDFEVELTIDQLPIFLLLSGFQEESQGDIVADLNSDADTGDIKIEISSLAGIKEGTDVTIDDGTNTETVTISDIDPKTNTITVDTGLTNAFTTTDGTTITNDTVTEHVFKPQNVLTEWGTGLIDFTDENMYKEFRGVRGDSLSISAQQKSYITASMSTMGLEGERVDESTVSSDYDYINNITEDRMIAFDSEIELNGTDITATVDDIEINLNNNIDGDDYAINSKIRRDLIATSSDADVSMTLQFNKEDYLNYKNQLENGNKIGLTYNILPGAQIHMPKVMLTEVSAPADTTDKITVSISGNLYQDTSTNSPLDIKIYDEITTDHKTELTDDAV